MIRTPLHIDTWATIEEIYAHRYMERHHPIDATELYDTLRVANESAARSHVGYADSSIYFRAPLTTEEGANGDYHRRTHECADQ